MITYELITILVLLVISFLFSASETALTAASRAKIHKLLLNGNRRAKMVEKLHKNKDDMISALLLGNNMVNIMASAIGTAISIQLFGEGEGIIYATIIMTALVVIFAEILPKTYAFYNPEKVSLIVAPFVVLLVKILAPIVRGIQWLLKNIMELFGINLKRTQSIEGITGVDALRGAIELHHAEGEVIKHERDMLGSVLDLAEHMVGDIMVHRKNMIFINIDDEPENIIAEILNGFHTRLPVYKENSDNVIGVIHTKNLVRLVHSKQGTLTKQDIEGLLMKPWFIPTTTKLKDQLIAFRERRSHFALVVDEYGALMGLITLEDILEEIVGQIDDEHDKVFKGVKHDPAGGYMIDGSVSIRDLNRELDWNLPDDKASTIAGLIMHDVKAIPEVGQRFEFHGFRFTILKKHRNQITSIRVEKLQNK